MESFLTELINPIIMQDGMVKDGMVKDGMAKMTLLRIAMGGTWLQGRR
jgi:hypothetical protein